MMDELENKTRNLISQYLIGIKSANDFFSSVLGEMFDVTTSSELASTVALLHAEWTSGHRTEVEVRKLLEDALEPKGEYCHHSGQWHAVPYALVQIVDQNVRSGNFSVVKYTTPGGNTTFATPVIKDSRVVRIDFCTDPGD